MIADTRLLKVHIEPDNKASLQRGTKLFINYCSGCHSLNFIRYNQLANDIGILDKNGKLDEHLVKESLIFTGVNIRNSVQVAMQKEDALNWFGVAPPDLSVIARARGVDWVYTYLLSFYQDPERPFGVNNLLFHETAMPDVLANLRGTQVPVYQKQVIRIGNRTLEQKTISYLGSTEPGMMSPQQFDTAVTDIVNFLAYVAEPSKKARQQIGFWVVGFLLVFAVVAFLLKKEYWKDIK